MSEKNFVAYGDAESILTGYANRIKQSPTTFVGTQAQWNALSSSQKAEYELVDITDDSLSPSGHVDWESNGEIGAKNLLENEKSTQTISGVTFTVNSDGSVIADGTATDIIWFQINNGFKLNDVEYTLTGCPIGGGENTYEVQIRSTESSSSLWQFIVDRGDGATGLCSSSRTYIAFIGIKSGVTVTNLLFKPMLRLATDSDSTYQPYSMTNKQITPYVQAISNPNLLDNPWFTVNQRGQSSYSAISSTYCVDRFRLSNHDLVINSDNSVTLTHKDNTNNGDFGQRIGIPCYDTAVAGKPVTVSVMLANGELYSSTKVAPARTSSSQGGYIRFDVGNTGYRCDLSISPLSNTDYEASMWIFSGTANATITIKAVKLELGSVSTLAMDTVPNYQQELAKCQRYFVRYKQSNTDTIAQGVARDTTKLRFLMPLPVPMRTSPSVTASSTVGDYTNTGLTITRTGTNVTYGDRSVGLIQLNAVSSTSVYTAGEAKNIAVTSDNFYIDFSADL